jgi:hypothetical protein
LTLDRALTVDDVITHQALGRLADDLWSLDAVLQELPALVVDMKTADSVCHGVPVTWSSVVSSKPEQAHAALGMPVRIHDEGGRLLAVGRVPQEQCERIAIEKVLVTHSV